MDQFGRKKLSIIPGSVLMALTLLGSSVQAQSLEESHESGLSPGVHQHGVAALNLAFDGQYLELEFNSPAANIFGFEHAARTSDEELLVQQSVKTLQQADQLFALSVAAGCRLGRVELESATDADERHEEHGHEEHGHDEDDHTESSHEHDNHVESHSDLRVHYYYQCVQPKQLKELDVLMFKAFPAIEKIHLQLITPDTQQGKLLTPEHHRVNF